KDSMEPTVAAAFLAQERCRPEELRFGAKCDQEGALLESQLGAWTYEQRAVAAPQRQQLGRRLVEQSGLLDGLGDGGHAGSDEQLLDSNPGLAMVERVQHVDEGGANGELGHPVPCHA